MTGGLPSEFRSAFMVCSPPQLGPMGIPAGNILAVCYGKPTILITPMIIFFIYKWTNLQFSFSPFSSMKKWAKKNQVCIGNHL
jgi:hypothetical protein